MGPYTHQWEWHTCIQSQMHMWCPTPPRTHPTETLAGFGPSWHCQTNTDRNCPSGQSSHGEKPGTQRKALPASKKATETVLTFQLPLPKTELKETVLSLPGCFPCENPRGRDLQESNTKSGHTGDVAQVRVLICLHWVAACLPVLAHTTLPEIASQPTHRHPHSI